MESTRHATANIIVIVSHSIVGSAALGMSAAIDVMLPADEDVTRFLITFALGFVGARLGSLLATQLVRNG